MGTFILTGRLVTESKGFEVGAEIGDELGGVGGNSLFFNSSTALGLSASIFNSTNFPPPSNLVGPSSLATSIAFLSLEALLGLSDEVCGEKTVARFLINSRPSNEERGVELSHIF